MLRRIKLSCEGQSPIYVVETKLQKPTVIPADAGIQPLICISGRSRQLSIMDNVKINKGKEIWNAWIPASAGMTKLGPASLTTSIQNHATILPSFLFSLFSYSIPPKVTPHAKTP
jgi:hypothetical protein